MFSRSGGAKLVKRLRSCTVFRFSVDTQEHRICKTAVGSLSGPSRRSEKCEKQSLWVEVCSAPQNQRFRTRGVAKIEIWTLARVLSCSKIALSPNVRRIFCQSGPISSTKWNTFDTSFSGTWIFVVLALGVLKKCKIGTLAGVLQGSEIAFSCSVAFLFLTFLSFLRRIWMFFGGYVIFGGFGCFFGNLSCFSLFSLLARHLWPQNSWNS